MKNVSCAVATFIIAASATAAFGQKPSATPTSVASVFDQNHLDSMLGKFDLSWILIDLQVHAKNGFRSIMGKERVGKPVGVLESGDDFRRYDTTIKFPEAADQEIVEDRLAKGEGVKFVAYFAGTQVEARKLFDQLDSKIKAALGDEYRSEIEYDDPESGTNYDKKAVFTRKGSNTTILRIVYKEEIYKFDPVKSYVRVELPSVVK